MHKKNWVVPVLIFLSLFPGTLAFLGAQWFWNPVPLTGLRAPLVNRIVTLQGGQINVHSRQDDPRGAVFTVRLPEKMSWTRYKTVTSLEQACNSEGV